MTTPIYMDAHATTPCDPRVVEAMLPLFSQTFGNASSSDHAYGWEAAGLIARAREQVAALINCTPPEIVFTSGGTESDNLAIKGVARANADRGKHIVCSAIEHQAVLGSVAHLEEGGFRITRVSVDSSGRINPDTVRAALSDETTLVSIMHANNEVGAIQPIAEIGAVCRSEQVFFHTDAAQSSAWEPLDVERLNVDLMTISAHKMYGPKGVGALYVRRRNPRVNIFPILNGGGHERGMRSGTLNVPGIVGMGLAAELALQRWSEDSVRIRSLRDDLQRRIIRAIPEVIVNGDCEPRLPNNLNIVLPGLDGENLAGQIRGVAISSGSACMSQTHRPSHVLTAMGIPPTLATTSLRFGLHRNTTAEDVERTAQLVIDLACQRLSSRAAAFDKTNEPKIKQ